MSSNSQDLKLILSSDVDNAPEPVPCEFCGKLRYTKGFYINGILTWMPYGAERCDCEKSVAEHEKAEQERIAKETARKKAEQEWKQKIHRQRIMTESGMGERFLNRTFENFEITDQNRNAYKIAKRFADNFHALKKDGKNGLFIAGSKGTGKTHISSAIANQLIDNGTAVICMTMIDLLERIKKTYNEYGEDESEILHEYKTVPLLIIDDIGKGPATEWAISTIYNIVNGRYESYLPIIVSTNYDDKKLIERMTPKHGDKITAEATLDRLREVCFGIVMSGDSWRGK